MEKSRGPGKVMGDFVQGKTTAENISRPSVKTSTFRFVWEFKTFHKSLFKFGQRVRSPEFSLESFSSTKHCFDFYPRGKTSEQRDLYFALYLVQTKGFESEARNVRFSCSLASRAKGRERDVPRPPQTTFVPMANAAWVHPCEGFKGGEFGLEIEVAFESAAGGGEGDEDSLEELSDDLKAAYDEELHWDMAVEASSKTYKVHRAVVEARFPQLRSESFRLPSLGPDFLEKLLLYMYRGKLDRGTVPIGFYDALSAYRPPKMQSILFANPRQLRVETSFTAKNISFPWIIRNVSSLKPGETLSCFFFADELSSWTWFQAFFRVVGPPDGGVSSETNIVVSLKRYSEQCKFIVCHVNVNGNKKIFTHLFESEDVWEIPPFVPRESLLQPENDRLTINFEICAMDGCSSSTIKKAFVHPLATNSDVPFANDLKQLQADMRKLFQDPKTSDLKLSAGTEVFEVHKFVLSARSTVFRNLIEQHLSTHDQTMSIDCDASVLKSMLRFAYSADVDISGFDHALKVYFTCHAFEIAGLKKACAGYVKSRLSPENAVRVLLTADDCSDEELVSHVLEYLCVNRLTSAVLRDWDKLKEREQLLKSLLEASFKHLA